MNDLLLSQMTPAQRELNRKHGTPAVFARAVYKCVPGDISMDEARAAVEKYGREWAEAGGGRVAKAMKNLVKVTVYKAKDGWRWRMERGGRIVADSGEAYTERAHCKRAVSRLLEAIRLQKWAFAD